MSSHRFSIGFSIAKRLGEDGAQVVVSSRKQANVDAAVEKLASQNLDVTGVVCHVGKQEDRQKLIDHVRSLMIDYKLSPSKTSQMIHSLISVKDLRHSVTYGHCS